MASPTVLIALPTTGQRLGVRGLVDELIHRAEQSEGRLTIALVINSASIPSWVDPTRDPSFRVVHEPRKGLSFARNAALDAASGFDFLQFIDDDEFPAPEWPWPLLETAERTGTAVAMGPIRAILPDARPWWLTGPELFRPPLHDPPGSYEGDVYSSNTLLRMGFVRGHSLRFDHAFNRSGGEDTDFFRRLRQAGGTVAWVPDAWVDETIDADRLTLGAYLRRQRDESATYFALETRRDDPRIGRHLLRRSARLGRGLGRLVAGGIGRDSQKFVAGMSDIAVVGGTTRAVLGWRPSGYAPVSTLDH